MQVDFLQTSMKTSASTQPGTSGEPSAIATPPGRTSLPSRIRRFHETMTSSALDSSEDLSISLEDFNRFNQSLSEDRSLTAMEVLVNKPKHFNLKVRNKYDGEGDKTPKKWHCLK